MSGHNYSIDGVLMFRQAVSIAQALSFHFAQPVHWGDTYTTSKYAIGLSLFYVPGVKVLSWLGVNALTPQPVAYDGDLFYRDPVYAIIGAPLHILVTVATAFLVGALVRALGSSSRTALFAMLAFGIASPALVYVRGDFAQPFLGLCSVAAVLAMLEFRTSSKWTALAAAGLALVVGVLARPVEGSFLLPALLALAVPSWRPSRWNRHAWRDVAVIGAAYAFAFAATLAVDWGRFGSPLETGYGGQINWGTPVWIGLPGVLISPARGILWEFPLIVLAPLGLWRMWLGGRRIVALVLTALVAALLINTALWVPWWGAWSWGSRLFVPAFPLLAVAAAIGAEALRPGLRAWLPAVLFAGGVLWALPGTFTDLLGGYAATYDGSSQSFMLSGYPPIGALKFLHHLRAVSLTDSHAVDVIWFRIARQTHDLSLLVPVILCALAAALGYKGLRTESSTVRAPSLQAS